jgi:hypothetical protein
LGPITDKWHINIWSQMSDDIHQVIARFGKNAEMLNTAKQGKSG